MKKSVLSICALSASALTIQAASIGINLGAGGNGSGSLALGDSAGVVAQANWNNTGGATGSIVALLDDSGVASTADISWAADEQWGEGTPVEPNGTLLSSFFSDNAAASSTVDITNIPYATYDLYFYMNHDRVNEDTILSEVGAAFPTFTSIETENDNPVGLEDFTTPVVFVQQTVSAVGDGNYVLFSGLTTSTLNIQFDVGAGQRSGLAGIQIVQVPEPSAAILALLSIVCLATRRRR